MLILGSLIFPSAATIVQPGTEQVTPKIDQNTFSGLSRPILVDVSGAGYIETLQARNDSEGLGGLFRVTPYKNVTIRYLVVNGDNTTIPLLYGRDGSGQLNFSIADDGLPLVYEKTEVTNVTLWYEDPVQKLTDVSVSYYTVELNVTSDYLLFYAYLNAQGFSFKESPDDISNLLTTSGIISSVATESFYIQKENVTIEVSLTSVSGNASYSLEWKTTDEGAFKRIPINITLSPSEVGDYSTNISLGNFPINTEIQYRVRALHNDSLSKTLLEIFEPALHVVGVFDGSPTINLVAPPAFTNEESINFTFSASVPKGEILNYVLNVTGATVKDEVLPGNSSYYVLDLANEGIYNVSLTAYTDKGLNTTANFTITADRSAPTFDVKTTAGGESVLKGTVEITEQSRILELNFTLTDQGEAGIALITINYGDNITETYVNQTIVSHRYAIDGTYNVTIIVADRAGNIVSDWFMVVVNAYVVNTDEVGMDISTVIAITVSAFIVAVIFNMRRR